MKITHAQESKIKNIDFDNLNFGEIFTDHMFVCDYKEGQWKTPEICPISLSKWTHLQVFFIMVKLFLKE